MNYRGVTVTRATLHNEDEIGRLGVEIGDPVLVERSGDVIPKVVRVVHQAPGGRFACPRHCPVCGGEIVREEGEAASRCINTNCPARLTASISALRGARRDGYRRHGRRTGGSVGYARLGEERRRHLRSDARSTCWELDRMGQKSAEKILRISMPRASSPLPRVLNGLGIPFVGERTAQILAETFGSLDAIADADEETLQQAEEVGPKVSESIRQFFHERRNRELVERLRKAGLTFEHAIRKKNRRRLGPAKPSSSPERFPTWRAKKPKRASNPRAARSPVR